VGALISPQRRKDAEKKWVCECLRLLGVRIEEGAGTGVRVLLRGGGGISNTTPSLPPFAGPIFSFFSASLRLCGEIKALWVDLDLPLVFRTLCLKVAVVKHEGRDPALT
jgi:hypothetical protein